MSSAKKLLFHGTRGPGLAMARESGFKLRKPEEVAKQVADRVDLNLEEILNHEIYGQTVGSYRVAKGLSVTGNVELAWMYATTGSGILSDILNAVQDLKPALPSDFPATYLAQYEPRPVLIEFEVHDGIAHADGLFENWLDPSMASEYVNWVWFNRELTDGEDFIPREQPAEP